MAQGLSELIYRLTSDAAFRSIVADSIASTAAEHGLPLDNDDRAIIADGLGRLMAPEREVGGTSSGPWPGGPSFTAAALDD